MSRFDRYFRALATGYGLLGLNVAYSLAVVPLALYHLGAKTFGLWALTIQIGAIVQLADAGMTGALNRILMDYKDDKTSTSYRQTFYTMWLAFSALGLIIAGAVYLLAPFIVEWLTIPPQLKDEYIIFLAAYGCVLGFNFTVKIFPMLPFVHQRSDLLNIISMISMVIGFAVLWFCLSHGYGLWSLLAGLATQMALATFACIHQCFRLAYFPVPSHARKLSRDAFMEVLSYGKDRLLITMGYTALQAAPTFLITRLLGLEANATWSVVSRMNQLCLQLIAKLSDLSYPALTEMHVRGEHQLMRRRYSHLLMVGLGVASLCAVGIATCNRDFVNLWTSGKIQSSTLLDAMLALWLLTLVIQRFLSVPTSIARDLKDVRYFYLLESLAVGILGFFILKPGGELWPMAAILLSASVLITIPKNFIKTISVLKCTATQLWEPMRLLGLRVMLPASILALVALYVPPALRWEWLLLKAAVVGLVMLALLCNVPALLQLVKESIQRMLSRARPITKN